MATRSWVLSLTIIVGGCASSVGPLHNRQPAPLNSSLNEASSTSLGQPLAPFELIFDDFSVSIPDRAACASTASDAGDGKFTLRLIEKVYLEKQMRTLVPPFAHRPCPAEGDGVSVEMHPMSGEIFLGPGNLLSDTPDGPLVDLTEVDIGAEEQRLLAGFFEVYIPRPLTGRSPPVLYACDGSICRAAFRHASTVVTAVWEQRPQPWTPRVVVDGVAGHLWAWTKHTPH